MMTPSEETGNGTMPVVLPRAAPKRAMGSFHLERQDAFFSVITIFKAVSESLLPIFQWPFSLFLN